MRHCSCKTRNVQPFTFQQIPRTQRRIRTTRNAGCTHAALFFDNGASSSNLTSSRKLIVFGFIWKESSILSHVRHSRGAEHTTPMCIQASANLAGSSLLELGTCLRISKTSCSLHFGDVGELVEHKLPGKATTYRSTSH